MARITVLMGPDWKQEILTRSISACSALLHKLDETGWEALEQVAREASVLESITGKLVHLAWLIAPYDLTTGYRDPVYVDATVDMGKVVTELLTVGSEVATWLKLESEASYIESRLTTTECTES